MARIIKNGLILLTESKVLSTQLRFYPRWSHRRPFKVYTPEEYEQIEQTPKAPKAAMPQNEENIVHDKPFVAKIKWAHPEDYRKNKPKKILQPLVATHQKKFVKKTTTDMLETVIDPDGNFVYKKLPNNDTQIATIITEIKSKKEKNKKDLILLEGKRLIKDALLAGAPLKYMVFSRKEEVEDLKPFLPKTGAKLLKMPYREMQIWSDLTTTPGIMGVFKIPDVENFEPKQIGLPITVICDNIREPGNLGALLRICAGVGCKKILLTKGCANVWDTKVLRSGVGAHFKLRIQKNMEWDEIEEVLVNSDVFIADNRIISTDGDGDNANLKEIIEGMPLLPYFGVDFRSSQHITLIVGGETCGISERSYEVASKLNGVRLNIPLENDVESLNVGAAVGVIAFEMKRQLLRSPE